MCSVAVNTDIYGFGLTGLSDSEYKIREECLQKTMNSFPLWMKKIRTKDITWFQKSNAIGKLKAFIRRSGIPPELRPEIWMALSGAKVTKSRFSPNYYQTLIEQVQINKKNERIKLESEVACLFKYNVQLGGNQGFTTVYRILEAFQLHRPSRFERPISGFAAVVAFLLVVIGKDKEEDVFWLLDSLIEKKLLNNSQREFSFNCQVQEGVLKTLLLKKNPTLYEYVEKFGSLSKIWNQWFSSLFVLTLPSETTARVWDCIFCEGSKVLLRVALALMNKNQTIIISMSRSNNLSTVLAAKMRRTVDANELLSAAFNSIGSMSSNEIERLGQLTECRILGLAPLPVTKFKSWKRTATF